MKPKVNYFSTFRLLDIGAEDETILTALQRALISNGKSGTAKSKRGGIVVSG
jgi:hypothetical protein